MDAPLIFTARLHQSSFHSTIAWSLRTTGNTTCLWREFSPRLRHSSREKSRRWISLNESLSTPTLLKDLRWRLWPTFSRPSLSSIPSRWPSKADSFRQFFSVICRFDVWSYNERSWLTRPRTSCLNFWTTWQPALRRRPRVSWQSVLKQSTSIQLMIRYLNKKLNNLRYS